MNKKVFMLLLILLTTLLNASSNYKLNAGKNQTIILGEFITLEGKITKGDIDNIEEFRWVEKGKALKNMENDEIIYYDHKNRFNNYKPTRVGKYILRFQIEDENYKKHQDIMILTVKKKNQTDKYKIDAGEDITIKLGEFVLLEGVVTKGIKNRVDEYSWQENGQTIKNMENDEIIYYEYENRYNDYKPTTTGKHTLTFLLTDRNGKVYTDTRVITVKPKGTGSTDTDSFKVKVKTDNKGLSLDNEFKIYVAPDMNGYNYNIDCDSDGVNEATNLSTDYICNYENPGIYTISISGDFPQPYFAGNIIFFQGTRTIKGKSDRKKIIEVSQWGTNKWKSMKMGFAGCINLTISATDTPDLSNVTLMYSMFREAHSFNQNINNWNVSNIQDMNHLFNGAILFNKPLSSWNVSSVTTMYALFSSAYKFNKKLNNWDVSSVTNMGHMFFANNNFNKPLNNWDVSSVTNMYRMFAFSKKFNKPISSWDVSSVSNMNEMFRASKFNRPLSSWDVSSVTNMRKMFNDNKVFNQDLRVWNVDAVTNHHAIFRRATSFNPKYSPKFK